MGQTNNSKKLNNKIALRKIQSALITCNARFEITKIN